jgi:hypothetical protein
MLFTTAGYRFVFAVLEKNATQSTEAVIDAGHFTEANLVEIKIPLHMPYYADKDYEVAYGETVINGTHYNYVKRKIVNNTLYLLCLPNTGKTKLVMAKTAIEKNNSMAGNENPVQSNKQASVIKLLQAEFLVTECQLPANHPILLFSIFPAIPNSRAGNLFIPQTPAQPPEQLI